MLTWALVFLLISIAAGVFGFSGIAVASASLAQILFFIFIVLFIVSLVAHVARKGDQIVDENFRSDQN